MEPKPARAHGRFSHEGVLRTVTAHDAQLLSQDAHAEVTAANLLERLDLERLTRSGGLISGSSSLQQAWPTSWPPCCGFPIR